MTTPIEVDIPHKLGREGAKARMAGGLDKLASFVPGGSITEQRWDGDTLVLAIEGMGQRVGARLTVLDAHIHAAFDLPPFLAMFANKIRDKLAKDGPKLLE
jgi:hypothetical protein